MEKIRLATHWRDGNTGSTIPAFCPESQWVPPWAIVSLEGAAGVSTHARADGGAPGFAVVAVGWSRRRGVRPVDSVVRGIAIAAHLGASVDFIGPWESV